MNNPGNKFSGLKAPSRAPGENVASVTESEDAIRNLKASQSVEAAFLAVGMPNPPSDIAAIITNQVKGAIKNLPLDQVRNMTPGTGPLGSALAAVDQYVGMLSPSQRRAAEQSTNTLSPTEMLKLHALTGRMDGSGSGEPASSRRYDGINQAFTETQKQALDLARKVGLDWAAGNPDLLRLGPAAIQALADVHLRQDSYKRLKGDLGLDDKTVVDGARYFKRNGGDYNQFSEDAAAVNKGLTAGEQQEHREAIKGLFRPNQTPQQEQEAQQKFNAKTEGFANKHPHLREHIEREREQLKVKKEEAIKADAEKANERETASNKTVAKNDALSAFDAIDSKAEVALPKKQEASAKPTPTDADKAKPKQVAAASKPKNATPT